MFSLSPDRKRFASRFPPLALALALGLPSPNARAVVRSCPELLVAVTVRTEGSDTFVTVRREGADPVEYVRTSRNGLELFTDGWFPHRWFLDLHGRRVLDAGCGGGAFVNELRAARPTLDVSRDGVPNYLVLPGPVDARGLDIHLDPGQKSRPEAFVEGDIYRLPFPDGGFDTVFSAFSVLSFEEPERAAQALAELRRVVKPGGTIRFGIVDRENLDRMLAKVPGLELVEWWQPVPEIASGSVELRRR